MCEISCFGTVQYRRRAEQTWVVAAGRGHRRLGDCLCWRARSPSGLHVASCKSHVELQAARVPTTVQYLQAAAGTRACAATRLEPCSTPSRVRIKDFDRNSELTQYLLARGSRLVACCSFGSTLKYMHTGTCDGSWGSRCLHHSCDGDRSSAQRGQCLRYCTVSGDGQRGIDIEATNQHRSCR